MARPEDKRRGKDALAKGVDRLSRLLTCERDRMPAAYLRDAELRSAYEAYFLPVNLSKMFLPLHELSLHPGGPLDGDRLRVLDVGAGPGTAILGILTFFIGREHRPVLEFTAVDQVAENLRTAEKLFRELRDRSGASADLRTISCRIEDLLARINGTFDLIVLSNVLNELFAGEERITRRIHTLDAMLRRLLADSGSSIIIEPALRETSRDLLSVRDGLLDAGWHVYSPCLLQEHCPALVNPKDWCHEDRLWEAPEQIREIDERTGLRKDSLKFTYCVLRKDGTSLSDVYGADAFRVVSEQLISKGKRELYLCGRGGRRLAMRLDKDASAANAPFVELLRGDIVRFEGLVREEKRYRIVKETAVTIACRQGDSAEEEAGGR